eukprot:2379094-Pyramimonas_sp.AAC.1
MRPRPLPGPLVELRMAPRSAALDGGDACGRGHWGFRCSSLWGHETLYWVARTRMRPLQLGHAVELRMGPGSAVLGGRDACGRGHWDFRWSS